MIIFDLDGTLADCEHRRHFVDPKKCSNAVYIPKIVSGSQEPGEWYEKQISEKGVQKKWQPDWQAFYEACDQDKPIEPTIEMLNLLSNNHEIQIWSGRCESVRDKTIGWLCENGIIPPLHTFEIKMRPIGDYTPDDVLKERWLDEFLYEEKAKAYAESLICGIGFSKKIAMVFDDRPKVIRMWQRRGIFVFNCCQHDKEF